MSRRSPSTTSDGGVPPAAEPAVDPTPWATKLGYAGVGIVVGVVIAPQVRKWLSDARPRFDSLFDKLTGAAEKVAENASDFMATARQRVHDEGEHKD